MNPHSKHYPSPSNLLSSLFKNRQLIYQLTKREIIDRYKGSVLGLGWSFVNPFVMLMIYTFVFSTVFKAKWGGVYGESRGQFAIMLFVGLIIHTLFAEVLNSAPHVIVNNTNYVKKVIFPLEILPVSSLGVAVFHSFVSFIVLIFSFWGFNGFVCWTSLLIPFVIFPFLTFILGCSWILASLGTFFRDMNYLIGILVTILLFLSPVFYPLDALPEKYHIYLKLNPLTFIIEQLRRIIIYGKVPDWLGLAFYVTIGMIFSWMGYWWFQKTRNWFADVL